MTEPLGQTDRLQAIRDGIAEGRAMGLWAEVVQVIDAISELRGTDAAIIAAIRNLIDQATVAITDLRADAVAEFAAIRTEASDAIALVRSDTGTAVGTLNTNTATAIAADRARLSTLEQAIVAPTTGILARLASIEARLTAVEVA